LTQADPTTQEIPDAGGVISGLLWLDPDTVATTTLTTSDQVKLWSLGGAGPRRTMAPGHTGRALAAAAEPGTPSSRFVTAGFDEARVWQRADIPQIARPFGDDLKVPRPLTGGRADGGHVYVAARAKVFLYDTTVGTLKPLPDRTVVTEITAVAGASGINFAAAGDAGGRIACWNVGAVGGAVPDPREVLTPSAVKALGLRNETLLAADAAGIVRRCKPANLFNLGSAPDLGVFDPAVDAPFAQSAGVPVAAGAAPGGATDPPKVVVRQADGTRTTITAKASEKVARVALAPDGALLLIAYQGEGKTLQLTAASAPALKDVGQAVETEATALAVLDPGAGKTRIAVADVKKSATGTNTLTVYPDLSATTPVAKSVDVPGAPVRWAAFSRSGDSDNRLWVVKQGDTRPSLVEDATASTLAAPAPFGVEEAGLGAITALTVARNGQAFTGHQDGKVREWADNAKPPRKVGTVDPAGPIGAVALDPASARMAAATASAVFVFPREALENVELQHVNLAGGTAVPRGLGVGTGADETVRVERGGDVLTLPLTVSDALARVDPKVKLAAFVPGDDAKLVLARVLEGASKKVHVSTIDLGTSPPTESAGDTNDLGGEPVDLVPAGRRVAALFDDQAALIKSDASTETYTTGEPTSSTGKKALAVADVGGGVVAFGLEDGRIIFRVNVASGGGTVQTQNAKDWQVLGFPGAALTGTLVVDPTGPVKVIAFGQDGAVRHWGQVRADQLAELNGHQGQQVYATAWSNDGWILTGAADGRVGLWKASALSDAPVAPAVRVPAGNEVVYAVAFNPAARSDDTAPIWFAAAGSDGRLAFGRKTSGDPGVTLTFATDLHLGRVYALAFHPDGRYLASGALDRTVKVWRFDGAAVPTVVQTVKLNDAVSALAFDDVTLKGESSPSRRIITATFDAAVQVWDVTEGATTTRPAAVVRKPDNGTGPTPPVPPVRAMVFRAAQNELILAADKAVFRCNPSKESP
jgi:hypothetical protein